MMNELKKNFLNEDDMANVSGGSPFPNESLVSDEMKVQRELQNLTPQEQMEVLQQPDAASQKAKIIEILDRRGVHAHGGAAYGANYYIVKKGDTLGAIASRYNTTVKNLMALNPQIKNANLIYPGDAIRLY